MGLSNHLHDVSGAGAGSFPLLLLASFASSLSSLLSPPTTTTSFFSSLGSGFASLFALADHLASFPATTASGGNCGDCAVCLATMADGDRVRQLACRHVFHAACLDGWFDESRLSCPLCRSVPPPLRDDADGSRVGADVVAWFSSL